MLPNLPVTNSISQVIGFEVEDKRLGVVGKIESINDSTAQPLFEVLNGSVEILIPMIIS
jgi:16S rRNA processing protein RimM